jgi:hypothetical protein
LIGGGAEKVAADWESRLEMIGDILTGGPEGLAAAAAA